MTQSINRQLLAMSTHLTLFSSAVFFLVTQEALLPQTDGEMCCHLKSCQQLHNSVGTSCTTKSRTNQSNGVRGLQSTNI